MKNVSNYYLDKVPIWNGESGGGEVRDGVGGYFEQHFDAALTSTVGWWDEQNMVSYGDDDILFSVFHFQASHFCPQQKLIIAVFSTLQWHVI